MSSRAVSVETQEAWLVGLPGATFMSLFRLFPQTKNPMCRGPQGDLPAFSCPKLRWTQAGLHAVCLCQRADLPLGHPSLGVRPLEPPASCEELSRILPFVQQGGSLRLQTLEPDGLRLTPSSAGTGCAPFLRLGNGGVDGGGCCVNVRNSQTCRERV